MVAGGVGLAPFVTLAEALPRAARRRRCSTARGAAEDLYCVDCFERARRRRSCWRPRTAARGVKGRVTAPLARGARADARRRAVTAVRVRPDADDARRRRARATARPRRAPCRSSRSWAAASAAATAASCSTRDAPAARRTSCARASTARCSTPPHRLGGAGALTWISPSRIGSLHARQPAHRRQRLLRLRRRVRRRRSTSSTLGGVAVKGLFLAEREGHPPPRIVETPAGHAQRDRPAGHRRPPLRREKLPELRDRRATVIVNICGTTHRRVRRAGAHPVRRRRRRARSS